MRDYHKLALDYAQCFLEGSPSNVAMKEIAAHIKQLHDDYACLLADRDNLAAKVAAGDGR